MNQANARIAFADWLAETHPQIYQRAIAAAEKADESAQLAGLGEDDKPKSFWEKFSETATALGTTYLTLKNQRDAMELNLARARQGLPPLDPATTAPVVRTQVQIDPATASKLASTAGEGINKMILLGAAAIGAFLLLKK